MKKIILFVSLFIVLLVVGVATWAYFAFLYTKPLSKAELAELTPDWSVVTHGNWSPWFTEADGSQTWNPAASFNAWLATVPEEDKAWPVLVDVYYKNYEFLKYEEDLGLMPDAAEDWTALRLQLQTEDIRADIERIIEALGCTYMGAEILAADDSTTNYSNATCDPIEFVAMQKWGVENPQLHQNLLENPGLLIINSPAKKSLRAFTGLLISYSSVQFEDGDIDGALRTLDAVSASAHLCEEYADLVSHLYMMAIQSQVNMMIEHVLVSEFVLTDEQLVQMDKFIERHLSFQFLWQGEAMSVHDSVRRMTNSSGVLMASGIGSLQGIDESMSTPTSLPDAQLGDAAQRMLHTMNLNIQTIDSAIPWDPTRYQAIKKRAASAKLPIIADMFVGILVPSIEQIGQNTRRFAQKNHSLRMAIAIERYRLKYGEFPKTVGDIDSNFLSFKPIDAFTGELLKYQLTDEGPLLYSVGDDRDDDAGSPMYDYDIEALFVNPPVSGRSMANNLNAAKKSGDIIRTQPLWISIGRMKEIEAVEPKAVDGDWVLYPTPKDD